MAAIYDFTAKSLAGEDIPLKRFEGQVLLIVNTASACGFTPQYKGLEALQQKLGPRGFSVLGFPCNQFGRQEPGDAGADRAVLRQQLRRHLSDVRQDRGQWRATPIRCINISRARNPDCSAPSIKWNFTKFLIDRSGKVVARHAPTATPEALTKEIEALL